MITAKNLKQYGFVPGEWNGLKGDDKYRSWLLEINEECAFEVDEEVTKGKTTFHPSIISDGCVRLNLDSVSKLLTLKDLLK